MTLQELLALSVELLERAGVPYMVTGSIASSFHGAPRATRDLDIVIDPDMESLDRLVAAIESEGLYVEREAAREALADRSQFNVIASSGWKVDFFIRKGRPFSISEFGRRRPSEVAGVQAWMASVEDLFLVKLEWARATDSDRQLRDVAEMIEAGGDSLDLSYIHEWLTKLELLDEWQRVVEDQDRA